MGECIIKIDGTEFINYSGNTRNGGTTTRIDGIGIRSKYGQNRWDDLVIFDTLGTINNSWPGEIMVVGVRPDANGAHSDLLGSDGNSVNNYQQVDEVGHTWTMTDYNGSATPGQLDTYGCSALGKTGAVIGVQPYALVSKSDAATRGFKFVMRSAGGTEVKSTGTNLSTTVVPYAGPVWSTDADGTAWTTAKVDSHEFGFEVT